MNIVQCPRCRDEVTVPAKASPKALVRCPLCLEEYLLLEALADMPPTLLVIDGSVPDDEPALVGAGVASAWGDDYRLSGGTWSGMTDSSAPAGTTAAPARPGLKATPRPKKKERSALAEGAQIIVGGLIGIALAPLILWWVFGNDTFELGPMVSPYAPWIVPKKFHAGQSSGTSTVAAPHESNPVAGNANSLSPANPAQPKNNGNNRSNNNTANPEQPAGLELTTDPMGVQPGDPLVLDNLPFEPTLPANPVKPSVVETSAPDPIALDPTALTPSPEPVKPIPAPAPEPAPAVAAAAPTPEQFQAAALAVADALEKVNETPMTASVEERRQKFTTMFQAGSQLGRIATQLDINDASNAPSLSLMRSFLAAVASAKGKISAVKFLAGMHYADRKHGDGILLAGTVKSIQPSGAAFEVTLDAGKGLEALAIVSPIDLDGICAVGDEVVLLGRIVEEPRKHLPAYEGEQTRVVQMAYLEPAPKME